MKNSSNPQQAGILDKEEKAGSLNHEKTNFSNIRNTRNEK